MKKIILTMCILSIVSVNVFANESLECISQKVEEKIPVINAHAAIVMDNETGRILYQKNIYQRVSIASTTKIMTGIVALENGNLEDIVTASQKAASMGGSTIKLKKGEQMKLGDMLYCLLMRSGNDSAIAISEHIGGSLEGFLDMMNIKVSELGLKDSHFMTPHGLDKDGHYSTAYDLGYIARYALKNKEFSQIVKTKETFKGNRSLRNTNEMLSLYSGADGVKTGYTGKAGRCLVTAATRNKFRLISVVLNCPSRKIRAESSKKILDYVFNNYEKVDLLKKESKIVMLPVMKGKKNEIDILSKNMVRIPLSKQEIKKIKTKIDLPNNINAPIALNTEVGSISYILEGKIIGRAKLITGEEIEKKQVVDYLKIIFNSYASNIKSMAS